MSIELFYLKNSENLKTCDMSFKFYLSTDHETDKLISLWTWRKKNYDNKQR